MTPGNKPRSPNRRQLLAMATACALPARALTLQTAGFEASLAVLEKRVGGRLGVALLDTTSGRCTGHRVDERFGMCSTFKLPLAAVVLRQIDRGLLRADQWVPYKRADLVAHAPVTRAQVGRGGMRVVALAEAAQTTSDNTAANLLLGLIGGPAGFTAALRELGDTVTRLDRMEPQMNRVVPGDERDTTTPAAMARTVARCLTGDALAPISRTLLIDWMVATETGQRRLRAGLPAGWRAGDKTGTAMAEGMMDKYNDVAITWPPGRAPLLISAYYETARAHGRMRPEDEAVLADAARLVAREFA